jgi:site-specific DNA-methyltransferase (adenine-specific)
VGGLNIDECRVGTEKLGGGTMPDMRDIGNMSKESIGIDKLSFGQNTRPANRIEYQEYEGRFPANIIHDGSEEVVDGFPNVGNGNNEELYNYNGKEYNNKDKSMFNGDKPKAPSNYNDNGTASRFFYTAKASKKDRDEGLLGFAIKEINGGGGGIGNYEHDVNSASGKYGSEKAPKRNIHPTVKPTDLMQYLIRLIAPKGATVLDLFMGSGSTGKAAMIENVERDANYHFIGIDRTEEYMPIAEARIEFGRNYATEKPKADGIVHQNQINIFNWQE